MKTVTLDEFDEATKSVIRSAASEVIAVVDQGVVIAEIGSPAAFERGRRFPPNHWGTLSSPRINKDSKDHTSDDRDR